MYNIQYANNTFHVRQVLAMAFPNAIVELSTADQRLTLFMYFSIVWTDQFLVWNATEYDGIDHISLSVDEIWHPKLMVNPANSDKLSYISKCRL